MPHPSNWFFEPYHPFPTTHWSLVAEAGHASGEAKQQALSKLLAAYLPPIQSYLVRCLRLDPDLAQEIVQSFVAEKVLERDLVGRAEVSRGRFRNFLMSAVANFAANWLRDHARPEVAVSWDDAHDEVADVSASARPVDQMFDVAWARQVLANAIELMERECKASARPDVWGVFQGRVLDPILRHADPVPYAELVRRFGFASPSQASNVLVTANRMFVRALRTVIGAYERDEAEIDQEIAELRRILSTIGAG